MQSQSPRRLIRALVALAAAAVAALPLLPATPAAGYAGAPWFKPSTVYTENFPDPHVLWTGSTAVAYGTSTGGAYLPVMTSPDLVTWTARAAYDPGAPLNKDKYFNDALPYPASWGVDRPVDGRMTKEVWAPGAARIGGRWVLYYAIRTELGSPGRFCISVATSSSPLGPFADTTSGPLVCDPDPAGSIDPAPFVDADGTPYLLWKSEGVPGKAPTRLQVRRLAADGLAFAGGTAPVELLRTTQPWEGSVIENPSMVRHGGRLMLFYSANEHASASYATGYADCDTPLGPCHKRNLAAPLLASHGDRLGPGGGTAFVDGAGRLQLAFHWWNAPYTSYPAYPECERDDSCTSQGQRRLAIEPLHHTAAGLVVGPPPFTAAAMSAAGSGGYRIVGTDGSVHAFGDAPFHGTLGGAALNAPIVAQAGHPGGGYWLLGGDGGVFSFGAPFFGSTGGMRLNHAALGMAAHPSGGGYWMVAADGGVFSFGGAPFHGSTGHLRLNQPIVGMAATRTGNGYWLVARDGGIFAFGDAAFHGSTGAIRLNQPIVGMAATPTGNGYWLVASDGGIFAFGDAAFHGSTGAIRLNQPIIGMASTKKTGYWLLARDGGVFGFGDAGYLGRPGA